MANPTLRGHQARIKIFYNNAEQVIDTIQRISIGQESSFSRQYFVGNPIPEGDQSQDGWSGTLDVQVRNPIIDDLIDVLINANQRGIAIGDYALLTTELYSDGSNRSYMYSDMQFKMNRDQGGLQEKIMKRLDFQASIRIRA